MSIQSTVADIRVRRAHGVTGLITLRTRPISLRVKVVSVMLLGTMLLILTAVIIGRSGTLPKIIAPPLAYLPGNSLPRLPKAASSYEMGYQYRSCVIEVDGQTIYLTFDSSTGMIVRSAFPVDTYQIGDLIVKWGEPIGIARNTSSVLVSWGTRSAVVYTDSFRPESRVEYIQYNLTEQTVSKWQGFANAKTKK